MWILSRGIGYNLCVPTASFSWKRLARLHVAGRVVRAQFPSTPPAALPAYTEVLARFRLVQTRESVCWRIGPSGHYRLHWPDAGTFDLDARRARVACFVKRGASPTSVEEVLRGPVCSLFLVEHGFEPLHAGAVVLGRGCAAFAGAPGAGKSSLIAHLVRSGARFLADDVLPLRFAGRGVRAWPGLPQLRLAPRSLRGLEWRARPLWATRWKATLPVRPAPGPKPVRRIFLLDRRSPGTAVRVDALAPREAFLALVSHTRNTAETARQRLHNQLQVCGWLANRVAVRRLQYPDGFDRLDTVRQAILEDLAP